MEILIFKGLTAQRLCKSFGVKGLIDTWFISIVSALIFPKYESTTFSSVGTNARVPITITKYL
jgi:hypothetical protein